MTYADTLAALLIAGAAMYGLGLPLAWLLPAPTPATWVYRIAVAPVYAILLVSATARLLDRLGVPLEPVLLLLMAVAAWAVAWWRTRGQWRIREALRQAGLPAALVALAALGWVVSLAGFGLYLPNRDFKNHAYFVAQVAWTRSADLSLVLRPAPGSDPVSTNFYPLGLHTLLGWALPWSDGNTVALTAAAAVLATAVSAPLAFVALARMWDPSSVPLAGLAGVGAVVLPGVTATFQIGSVAVLVATALYAAGLVTLWIWVAVPSRATTAALLAVGLGLFFLHVAEGIGLGLVALVCLPVVLRRFGPSIDRGSLAGMGAVAVVMAAVLVVSARRMFGLLDQGFEWDVQPNTDSPASALLVALAQQPGGSQPIAAVIWLSLTVIGLWLARVRRMSQFPLVALLVPVALGTIAGARGVPGVLALLAAPWYGSAFRVALMAAAPVALAGCLALVRALDAGRRWPVRVLAVTLCVGTLAAFAVQIAPTRRSDLRAALAGAGNTQAIAQHLVRGLEPGETVLNLEGDGTAELFAYARVPVLSGLDPDPALERGSRALTDLLLQLGDPSVAGWLADLKVQFIVLGTTSRYWDSGMGYVWQDVARQPQVTLEIQGTDLVVLRYTGAPS